MTQLIILAAYISINGLTRLEAAERMSDVSEKFKTIKSAVNVDVGCFPALPSDTRRISN